MFIDRNISYGLKVKKIEEFRDFTEVVKCSLIETVYKLIFREKKTN